MLVSDDEVDESLHRGVLVCLSHIAKSGVWDRFYFVLTNEEVEGIDIFECYACPDGYGV